MAKENALVKKSPCVIMIRVTIFRSECVFPVTSIPAFGEEKKEQ